MEELVKVKKENNFLLITHLIKQTYFLRVLGAFLLLLHSSCKVRKPNVDYLKGGYYTHAYKADSLFLAKDYQASFNLLHETFDKFRPIDLPIYSEMETYTKSAYLSGNESEAYKALKRMIAQYGFTLEAIENDDVLFKIYKGANLNEDDYTSLRRKFKKNAIPHLKESIGMMKERDQKYRSSWEYYKKNKKLQDSIDFINLKEIKSVFDTYGYPSFIKLGLNPNYNREIKYELTTILLHTKDSTRVDYILPKLKFFITHGQCDPLIYGRVYDQLMIYNKKRQKYGTYETDDLLDQISLDSLNYYRKSIGLPAYKYQKWRMKKIYGLKDVPF